MTGTHRSREPRKPAITGTFPPAARTRAVSAWAAVAGGSALLGLLCTGALLEWFSWRSAFAVNVVLAVIAIVGAIVFVPESSHPDAPRLDTGGALLAMAGLTALVFSIIEAPEAGWATARTIGGIAAGLAVLAVFTGWEHSCCWPRPPSRPGSAWPRWCGRGGPTRSQPTWAASAPITFDRRQWRRQVRTARGLTEAPGAVPLLARGGKIPVGGTIRAIGHCWHPVFTLPAGACARHMVIVGATGSGKTNLMIRLWAGWFTATLEAARAGRGRRPLLIVLDCKGGRDARCKADRTRRLLYGAGARRVAIWPDEARLSLWDLPARELAVLLYQMIDTGDGNAAYYADILQATLTLAVTAPGGAPANAAAFLDRLDARWLKNAWSDGQHPQQLARVQAAAKHLHDVQSRMATLLNRLGPALNGPGTWPTRAPGTSSWKAPANPEWPKPRRWR